MTAQASVPCSRVTACSQGPGVETACLWRSASLALDTAFLEARQPENL